MPSNNKQSVKITGKKRSAAAPSPKEATSWGKVSEWYDEYLENSPDNYQEKVIAPNLLRILSLKKTDRLLDVACGQGFFTRKFAESGAQATGADIAPELIAEAKKRSPRIAYHVAPADALSFAKNASADIVTIVLAIQNIRDIDAAFVEAARVLTKDGRLALVLNHPAFRIPKRSSWQWDDKTKTQYRRIDGYLSESKTSIVMHPGQKESAETISYHRSLQHFFKSLGKAGFQVSRLEEWTSHKKSQRGPRQETEDRVRKEIPLFMMIEAKKF